MAVIKSIAIDGNTMNNLQYEEYYIPKTINVPNNSMTNTPIWTVPVNGAYYMYCILVFGANATGSRQLGLVISEDGGSTWTPYSTNRMSAAPTGNTVPQANRIVWLRKNDVVGIRSYQNSGAALSAELSFVAYLIG